MSHAIWPNGKTHTLDRAEFVWISEDGETIRYKMDRKMSEHLHTEAFSEIAKGNYEK